MYTKILIWLPARTEELLNIFSPVERSGGKNCGRITEFMYACSVHAGRTRSSGKLKMQWQQEGTWSGQKFLSKIRKKKECTKNEKQIFGGAAPAADSDGKWKLLFLDSGEKSRIEHVGSDFGSNAIEVVFGNVLVRCQTTNSNRQKMQMN